MEAKIQSYNFDKENQRDSFSYVACASRNSVAPE
jgi:hypothetical protein